MKRLRIIPLTGITILSFLCCAAHAEPGQPAAPEMEQHGTHEHGSAHLYIAVSEDGLEIVLNSPAINLTGFEHMPNNEDDKQHLKDIESKLEHGDTLFTPSPEANCELKDTEVLSGLLGDELGTDEQSPTTHDEHQDMEVTWAYACTNPAQLQEIKTTLFTAFPDGLQRLHVEWVTPSAASAVELEQDGGITLK